MSVLVSPPGTIAKIRKTAFPAVRIIFLKIQPLQVEPFFFAATKVGIGTRSVVAAGTGATPAAFYLGLCRLRGILSLPSSTTTCRRRAILHCSSDGAASILKSGLEIKNRCTLEGVNGEKLTSIPKFGPEIKNRCTKEGVNGEKLTSILKFGPEIKNHCIARAILESFPAAIPKLTPSNPESLHAGVCF